MKKVITVTVTYSDGSEREWTLKQGTAFRRPTDRSIEFTDEEGSEIQLFLGANTDFMIDTSYEE